MNLRVALFLIEWNLTGLYAIGLCVLYPAIPVAFFYCLFLLPWIPLLKSGTLLGGLLVLAAALILAAAWQAWARGGVAPVKREPLREDAFAIGGLEGELKKFREEFRAAPPERFRLMLAPPASLPPASFLEEATAGDPGEIPLPLGCLGVWSVLELRCHLAHFMTRRRGPRWLFRRLQRQLQHIDAEGIDAASRGVSNWRTEWLRLVGDRINAEVSKWQLLAGLEADRKAARIYGAGLVTSWIRKAWQAEATFPWYRTAFIEPAASQSMLFPIAEGYVDFHHQIEPSWSEAEEEESRDTRLNESLHPVLTRIEALQHAESVSAAFDSRPAASLFADLRSLEERVVRTELDLPKTQRFERLEIDEYAHRVLIPLLREDLARNRHIFSDAAIEDLPAMVGRSRELAESFIPRPVLLLDAAQRRAMIPGLLAAFLLVELTGRGWEPGFTYWEGFRLRQGEVEIDPTRVVQELAEGSLTPDGFVSLITARSA